MLKKKKEKKAAEGSMFSDGPPTGLREIQRQREKQRMGNEAPEELKPLHPFGEDYQKAELAKTQAEIEKTEMEKRKSREILARRMRRPRVFLNLRTKLGAKE